MLFYNFVYHYREQDAKTQGLSQYARLSLVLQTSSLRLCFYNVRRRHYIFLNENGEYSKEYNPVEFAELFDRDDFEQLRKLVFDICEERIRTASVRVRGVLKEDDTRDVFEDGRAVGFTGFVRTLFEIQNQKECGELLLDAFATGRASSAASGIAVKSSAADAWVEALILFRFAWQKSRIFL